MAELSASEDPAEVSNDDRMRDAVVTTNIGVSAGATAGIATTAAVLASGASASGAGAAVNAGAGAAGNPGSGVVVNAGAGAAVNAGAGAVVKAGSGAAVKAGAAGLAVKVGAGAAGVLLVGSLISVGLSSSGAGGGEAAPIVGASDTEVVDESIREMDFADVTVTELGGAAQWLSNVGLLIDELDLTGGEATLAVGNDLSGDEATFAAREPAFADLDGDGRLDAVMVIDMVGFMNAHDFLSLVVAWRQTADGPQQVPHSLGFSYGMHQGLWGEVVEDVWVDDGVWLSISSSVGPAPEGGSVRVEEAIRLALSDGWLVRDQPSYGAVSTCAVPEEPYALDAPSSVWVADDRSAPQIDGDFVTAYIALDFHGVWEGALMMVRLIDADGNHTCGWVPSEQG